MLGKTGRGGISDQIPAAESPGTVADERRAEIIEMEVMPDHVNLLVEIDPQFGIHRLVEQMKGSNSTAMASARSTSGASIWAKTQ